MRSTGFTKYPRRVLQHWQHDHLQLALFGRLGRARQHDRHHLHDLQGDRRRLGHLLVGRGGRDTPDELLELALVALLGAGNYGLDVFQNPLNVIESHRGSPAGQPVDTPPARLLTDRQVEYNPTTAPARSHVQATVAVQICQRWRHIRRQLDGNGGRLDEVRHLHGALVEEDPEA